MVMECVGDEVEGCVDGFVFVVEGECELIE